MLLRHIAESDVSFLLNGTRTWLKRIGTKCAGIKRAREVKKQLK
jgi:hypothetical protein